jgi:hypothetical protein
LADALEPAAVPLDEGASKSLIEGGCHAGLQAAKKLPFAFESLRARSEPEEENSLLG